MKIVGTFEVHVDPVDYRIEGTHGINLARSSLQKTFLGELNAESSGTMLSAMTAVKGSAGYVAIEQVVGILGGRQGTFVLQHFGTMNRGEERLILEVVPDSATGDLTGLVGSMSIRRDNGQHSYEFDYTLPD